jgi:hypothetical protein
MLANARFLFMARKHRLVANQQGFVMMDVHETLAVAVDALRSNKLRTLLTSLGVIIGSAAIVLVVTVALTSQKFVIGQIEAIGSNLLWVELVKSSDKAVPQNYEITMDGYARGEDEYSRSRRGGWNPGTSDGGSS